MSALANTMQGYLEETESESIKDVPSVFISRTIENVVKIMADPFKLHSGLVHKMIRMTDGRLVEARMHGDIDLRIEAEPNAVCYTWSHEGVRKRLEWILQLNRTELLLKYRFI